MKLIRCLLTRINAIWSKSIRRQLALSFSLAALLIMFATISVLFIYQRDFLYTQNTKRALDLARSLSFSSSSWVLADDVMGLQEVLLGVSETSDIKFALVISPQGEVLASTNPAYIGQFFNDTISLGLLTQPAEPQILLSESNLIDVAVPVKAGNRLIGWVRVELTRDTANANLHKLALASIGIMLLLLLVIVIIARCLASKLTSGLNHLMDVAKNAEHGLPFQREAIEHSNEIGELAHQLYQMLEAIEAEKQAKFDSEARFRKLLKVAPIPMSYVLKNGVIQYINDRCVQVFGYSHEEIPGMEQWWQLAYPKDTYRQWVIKTWNEAVQRAAKSGQDIQPTEYSVTCKNGDVRIMEISGVILGEDFLATFIDLTERKQAEAVLKASEARFQAVFNNAGVALAQVTTTGRFLHINQAFCKIIGYSHEEVLSEGFTFQKITVPEDVDYDVVQINRLLNGEADRYTHEKRYLRKDGSIVWGDLSVYLQRDETGKALYFIRSVFDITDRKRADAELKEYHDHLEQLVEKRTTDLSLAKEAAEAANIAKSAFIATMSHELRTPLNAILGFSELMSLDDSISPAQKETLGIINRSGAHLLSMINEVLDISKIEAGRLELEMTACDLLKLLEDIGSMISVRAANKKLIFTMQIAPDIERYIEIDSGKLRQVLINLLGNAIKFTQQGEILLRANTQALAINNKVLLSIEVIDTGIGIPEELQADLFKPFVQLAQTDSRGTGLGLAISKSLIELMGGHISIISSFGTGSNFKIELPVIIATANDMMTEQEYHLVESIAPNQPAWRILVVDDNADNRLLLMNILGKVGFQIQEAENGQQAIELFEQWQPHLIWMDMRMPVLDGYQASKKIRQLAGGDTVKIIAITASAFKEQHDSIINSGCDAVVHKPFQIAEIFATLTKVLGVKFIYGATPAPAPTFTLETKKALLSKFPLSLRQKLHEAALELDTEAIDVIITEIRDIDADIANSLQVLAAHYQFEQIIHFVDAQTRV
jgi:PAS domain S-box-containing protein